jgi:heme exporter protein D
VYFPEGLKKRGEGPGALLIGGAAIMSLIFGAAAFGWIGVAIGVVGLFVLLCAEVYRDASSLYKERSKLRDELRKAQAQARSAGDLEGKNQDLEHMVDELRRKSRRPSLDPGQLLLGIKAYLDQVKVVRKHRELNDRVKDALVTKVEMTQGKVTISALCPEGAEHLDQQLVAFVDRKSDQTYGGGLVVSAVEQDVRALFDVTELPADLADDLASNGSFSPRGYVLRLLGLCFEGYQQLDDETLENADEALEKAREALTTTLLPQAGRDPDELLRELEANFAAEDDLLGGTDEPGTATLEEVKEEGHEN